MSEPKTDREHLELIIEANEQTHEPRRQTRLALTIHAAKQHLASPESDGAGDPFSLTLAECAMLNHAGTSDEEFGRTVRQRLRREIYPDPSPPTPPTEGEAEGPYKAGDLVSQIPGLEQRAWVYEHGRLDDKEAAIANAAYAAGASTRGSGEAAEELVAAAKLAFARVSAECAGVKPRNTAAEVMNALASPLNKLAQNPSRGSDGLREDIERVQSTANTAI